jgi:hypothetical protein
MKRMEVIRAARLFVGRRLSPPPLRDSLQLSSSKSHTIKSVAWCFRRRDMWGEPQRRHVSLPVAPDVRVQGAERPLRDSIHQQQKLLKPSGVRAGFRGLIAILDPDVVVRIDEAARRPRASGEIRGARNWAKRPFAHYSDAMEPMLVDGAVGLVWAPPGQL